MPVIGNSSVKRVLVDGGASIDILFHETFIRMGYNDSQLTLSDMHVYGFNGVDTKVEGIIQLPIYDDGERTLRGDTVPELHGC